MVIYQITLLNEEQNISSTIRCNETVYILDAAEKQGIELPYSCRVGACSACTGKLIEGKIDQTQQTFLNEDQIKSGFVLTCVGCPKSDCTILINQDEKLY